jgi:hypothetical protein
MCGRFASFLPAEAMARIFGTVNPLPNLAPSWNVAPTNDCAVVRRHPQIGQHHLDLLTWGLLPYWTKEPAKAHRPISARSETAATSGMFKDALTRRRCLVPADAFYEWKVIEGGKQPYAIARLSRRRSPASGRVPLARRDGGTLVRSPLLGRLFYERLAATPGAEIEMKTQHLRERPADVPASRVLRTALSPSSRIGGFFASPHVVDQRVSRKGLHYTVSRITRRMRILAVSCGVARFQNARCTIIGAGIRARK